MNEDPQAPEAIAIIGMSGRFPEASNPDEFWRNLIDQKDCISRFPGRVDADGTKYVGARSILEKPDLFDASFFNIYPKEAELMDPQHRVFLECAWEALEHGACDPATYPGLIGVYAGLSLNTYLLHNLGTGFSLAKNYQVSEYQTMLGNDKDFLPVRVSYKLNLRGPSMTIQTACSTSLVAICQAATSLLTYQCDMALAGGVSISFPQHRDYIYQEDGMVSPDGTCRAFDANAAGTVFGHGCGVVLLKRLSEAVQNGDPILAVIKGWAVNNDGSDKIGFAAPGLNAQADVIALAQSAAGVHPSEVSYIEAHGTGTPLGDPIEVSALTKAFREGGAEANGFCAIGTGKTHIGHLDCAAGVTGLIKTVQQFRHEKIPALLHFKAPNPRIDFANSPFRPVESELDWKRSDVPRIAGVSAFGVGGTNAHVVVEEAPLPLESSAGRSAELLILSARTPTALSAAAARLADHLESEQPSLPDVAFTLAKGRRVFPVRTTIVAKDANDAVAKLKAEIKAADAPKSQRGVCFLFPGQGSQSVGMTRGLYEAEPVFRDAVDECAVWFRPLLQHDIRATLYPSADSVEAAERDIHLTNFTQPCIFTVEYALAKFWISLGVKPALLIGHSIGEYVAAVIAGTFSLEHATRLLSIRARMMQNLPGGSMLAIRKSASELNIPADLCLAAVNSPHLCTVSGPSESISNYQKELEFSGTQSRILSTSHAFHSSMMDAMIGPFTEEAAMVPARTPEIPWISTCTGSTIDSSTLADPGYWARQLRQPVLFSQAVEQALKEGNLIFLESGPGQALSQFVRQHPDRANEPVVSTLPGAAADTEDFAAALGELWKHGADVDWDAWITGQSRRKLNLPTYPFERQSYWVDQSASATTPAVAAASAPTIPVTTPSPSVEMISKDRLPELTLKLRALIRELSGIEATDDKATFTELGFDSLFLTQASQAVQSRFGVKVTFRQMLGDLSSVASLAAHLDAAMPPDAPAKQVAPTTPAVVSTPQTPAAGNNPLEQLLANNLQMLQTLMAGQGARVSAPPSNGLSQVLWPSRFERSGTTATRFGPFKPLEKGESGGLTVSQETYLNSLITRYTGKTPGSKAYTAEHRGHFADPRAVSGFKSQWKEMVYPIVSSRSKGSRIWDVDCNEYVDITMGFGTYFFGHSPDWLQGAISEQLASGMEIGPQSAIAGKLAGEICDLTGMDRATFCNTGSEAVMAAMRLARTITGRNRIAYFTGDYHGMFEEVLVRGSWVDGVYKAQPIAPGIPDSLVENMLVLDYADPASLEILKAHAHELAAVMVEPVQSRAPGLQPRDFMREVRSITKASGTALIFDEVVTGFRCAPGGAQAYFGVEADLATYGKVIGGGMPIGVLAGKREYMDALDGGHWSYGDDSFPEVGVTFFAGTFVRHPLAMAAAWRVVQHLKAEGPRLQIEMEERVARFCRTLNHHLEDIGVPIRIPHFSAYAVIEHAPDLKHASLLWYALREKGVHVWEGRPLYFTTAHTDEDFDFLIRSFVEAIADLQSAGFLPASREGHLPAPIAFPRCDLAPTTEAQREIFHAVQMGDEANCAFNESNIIRFEGELDVVALKSALVDIVTRHPALRSTFSEDGNFQFFHPSRNSVELIEHDFRSLNPNSPSSSVPISLIKRSESSMPFDLTHGPLVRFELVRLSNQKNELLFTAHHMICDGWSFGMILSELAVAYNARKSGGLPRIAPAMSFADYARQEKRRVDSRESQAAEDYWVAKYINGSPVLDLPTDRPRPPVKGYKGAMESIVLDPTRFERLKKASPALGGTVFATLLTSFATLLHRLTGQDDLVIGVPAAGQTRIGCDELIGHCLNFLPLRLHPGSERNFKEFAAEVRETVLEAYDYQDFTFGSLLRKIPLERDTSRVPLVSVIFNIDKNGTDQIRFDDLQFDVETNPKQFVNFDLFFNLVQTDTRMVLECEYNTDLHDASTIRGWLEAFEQIIDSAITNGDTPLGNLNMLNQSDKNLLADWNRTGRPIAAQSSIQQFFEEQVVRQPHAPAIRAGGRTLSYQELDRHANALAEKLGLEGVRKESLVGICAERKPETVVAILAILKAGGAYVPIDPKYPKDRIAYILNDASAPVLLTQQSLAADLPLNISSKVLYIDDCLNHSSERKPSSTQPKDLAYVIYTSGSTGLPKGVAIEHRNTIALIDWALSVYQPEELAGVLFSTSICFDLSVFEMFVTLAGGGCMILAENALELGAVAEKQSITLINTVPSAISELLDAELLPSSVKTINLAGEALTETLSDRIYQSLPGVRVYDLYGPSEDTTYSTFALRTPGGRATIGRPISNTTAHIVNEHGNAVPPGVAGELLLGGAGLARGYLNRPELTSEKFVDHPEFGRVYRTGDRARFFENGELQFLGRIDHQVKLRGYRIELGEIEAQLEKHPAVGKAIAQVWDGRLLAYVTNTQPEQKSEKTEIWKDQWDMLYQTAIDQTGTSKLDRLDSVIAGWADVENLDEQVTEWIDTTLERIRGFGGRRFLEIGCGTGQLLSRLAPDADCYWGADISKVAIDALNAQHPLPQVKLLHRPADDFSEIPDSFFDVVIINSVAQYFPGPDYLERVISSAARTLAPGGRIFLGDIQSNALLSTYHSSALRGNATNSGELRATVEQRIHQETELSVDPAWFATISSATPLIRHVEVLLRRGKLVNETTAYHYDVILHVGATPALKTPPAAMEWKNLNLEQLEAMLYDGPEILHFRSIPDSRLQSSLNFRQALSSAASDDPLPELPTTSGNAINAEDLYALAAHAGYRAHVRWQGDGTQGALEAVFVRASERALPDWRTSHPGVDPSTLTNTPRLASSSRDSIEPLLKKHLAVSLPDYMIPARIVTLDEFPLTPNGKIDRKALPVPHGDGQLESTATITDPRNETEAKLLEIWKQVLGKDKIGVEDDIFGLGGDSILIFQITTRANRIGLGITPAHVFKSRTIAALAGLVGTAETAQQAPSTIQRVNRDAYRRNL